MAPYQGGRPAETAALSIGGLTLAAFTILKAYGVNVPEGVPEASIVLVGGVATVVTWWINRRHPPTV